ncbi:MAG: sigma-70 family RNA polymerase sigma factor [Verrucomicrobiae bacterium]|nr:sigma-70 family RNA polymerase sigma factor [Verrucomicrobiae bacterium]
MMPVSIPMEKSDREHLRNFVETGSEGAFEALVRRHAGVVFGAGLRVTRNREMAEDVAQLTFAILLRKASALVDHSNVVAWLHKTATLEALRIMRKERNYRRVLSDYSTSVGEWQDSNTAEHPALGHLDEAIAALESSDRHFLVMRFYQGHTLRELAPLLGKSESAVRKQSERALSRLAGLLHRRGVVLSTAAVAGVLSEAFVETPPAGLVTSICNQAGTTAASLSHASLSLNTLQTMTYGKQIALTAITVVLLAAVPIGIQNRQLARTKAELREALSADRITPQIELTASARAKTPASTTIRLDPDSLLAQALVSGTSDAEFLRNVLMQQVRPHAEEISAFIGEKRSLSELQTMFDEVVGLPMSEHQRSTLLKLVQEIGRHDGRFAVELAANSIEASALRAHALGAAYAGWAAHDPDAAWAYANALPPEQRASHPYWQIMKGAAEGDLSAREFYDFVEANSDDLVLLSGGQLWQALAHVYEHKDSSGMPAWVGDLPEGNLRNLASAQLVQRWSLSDPTAAKEWMESHVDLRADPEPALYLAKGWAQVDPQATMDWLTSLPRELQTKEQFGGALEKWLSFDQVGAARWLADAKPSPLLDVPFERYVARVRHANPPEAMNWARSITDPDQRLRVMNGVAHVWQKKDPAGLEQFLASDPAGGSLTVN